MADPVAKLLDCLQGSSAQEESFTWQELNAALRQASDSLVNKDLAQSKRALDLLGGLLARGERVHLHPEEPVPHSMPPDELLQRQALERLEERRALHALEQHIAEKSRQGQQEPSLYKSLEKLSREATSPALRQYAARLLAQLTP